DLHMGGSDHWRVRRMINSQPSPLSPHCDGGLGLLEICRKRRGLSDRKTEKSLGAPKQPRLAETADEPAVGEPEGPHCRVEPLDPERSEGAFATLAVSIGVLVCLLYRLLCDANGILAPPVITLGGLQDFFVLGVRGDTAFDACHG